MKKPYYIFESFEALIDYLAKTPGSYYERDKGLVKRHVYGKKISPSFGNITYVTDDGRVALIWAFKKKGIGWFFVYPDDGTLIYFRDYCAGDINAILENNTRCRG